jgi:hypothetical protein
MGYLRGAAGVVIAAFFASAAVAQAPAGEAAADAGGQRLDVAANTNETVVEGVLSGFATARYLVSAGAGQELRVSLESDNAQATFDVLAPGSGAPVFNGARNGRSFGQSLHVTGDYTIEVHLARAAARRSEAAQYTMKVSLNGTAVAEAARPVRGGVASDDLAGGPDFWEATNVDGGGALAVREEAAADAAVVAEVPAGTLLANGGCRVVAGQRWCAVTSRDDASVAGWAPGRNLREAVGVAVPEAGPPGPSDAPAPALAATEIACATAPEQPLAACAFIVDRVEGAAAVRVALPGGGLRVIRFVNGEPVTSDGTGAFTARHEAGTTKVGIGDERYEIPDAVVRGS